MSKRTISEINVRGKVLQQVNNITVYNAAFSAHLTKYLNTWIAIQLEKHQAIHGPVEKSENYQTYADTQSPAKSGRKISQTKKDKEGVEKTSEVSPKSYFTNLGNLKLFLNYFLIKYALELRYIFIANEYEFDRNYNEEQLEADARDIISNPLIPFVLHVAKQFDAKTCDYDVTFDGMLTVKQIFKNNDNGQASTKKIEQFMNKFLDFVNVFIINVFTISFPHKALLHIDYIVGMLDVFNNTAGISELGKDVLDDLKNYLKEAIKKPVKGTGKKAGTGAGRKKKTETPVEEEASEEDPVNDDDDIPDDDMASYSDI